MCGPYDFNICWKCEFTKNGNGKCNTCTWEDKYPTLCVIYNIFMIIYEIVKNTTVELFYLVHEFVSSFRHVCKATTPPTTTTPTSQVPMTTTTTTTTLSGSNDENEMIPVVRNRRTRARQRRRLEAEQQQHEEEDDVVQ